MSSLIMWPHSRRGPSVQVPQGTVFEDSYRVAEWYLEGDFELVAEHTAPKAEVVGKAVRRRRARKA